MYFYTGMAVDKNIVPYYNNFINKISKYIHYQILVRSLVLESFLVVH